MGALDETIRQKYQFVLGQIEHAAVSASRCPEDVRLVVVTKAQPVAVAQAVIDAGASILGENYPEETLPKLQALSNTSTIQWHMIGHLQTRKVRLVVDHFHMLESLDSLHLAEKIERSLAESDRQLPALLEMNVSGEQSKSGFPAWDESHWDRLLPEIETILQLPHVNIQGVMTMPPLFTDPEQVRPYFVRLRKLADFLCQRVSADHFKEISMGTSTDYPVAVQEGATYVRVGTSIVGPRAAITT